MSKIWVGVDPGERWTGVVTVLQSQSDEHQWYAEMGVIDQKRLGLYYAPTHILHYVGAGRELTLIAEDYRARPVGHQRWTDAKPVRLLGALEMVAQNTRSTWVTIPAGKHGEQLAEPLMKLWWRTPSPFWKHAVSAWRVLLLHLWREKIKVKPTKLKNTERRFQFWQGTDPLIAPAVTWRTDK